MEELIILVFCYGKLGKLMSRGYILFLMFIEPTSHPPFMIDWAVYFEYPVVERDHDEAGDVEGAQTGPDDEVRVVEGADDLFLLHLEVGVVTDDVAYVHVGDVADVDVADVDVGDVDVVVRAVVEAGHDGETDGAAGGPAGGDDAVGRERVVPVLAVHDGRGDGQEPVQADGHQVEDGGGGADHVTGQVEVTDGVGETPPTPVCLKENSCLVVLICNLELIRS